MDKMTDSRAVNVLERLAIGADEPDVHAALTRAIARLREPAEAQARGGGEIYQAQWRAVEGRPWEDITREEYDALRSVEAVTRIVYLAPPSAPVGVEGFDEWFDEYTKNNYTDEMLALAAWEQALAQQPAAVDGACGDACAHIAIERDMLQARAERLAEALREAYGQVRELCDAHVHPYPEASFARYEAALHPTAALLRDQEEGSGAFWGPLPNVGGPDWTGYGG